MSDEQPVPLLRLRPRKRDDESAHVEAAVIQSSVPVVALSVTPTLVPQPAADESAPAVLAAADLAPLRIRLKPKLSSEPEVNADVFCPEPAPSVAHAALISAEPPGILLEPNTSATPGIPLLKLKPFVNEGGGGGVASTPSLILVTPPPIATTASPPSPIPPFPVVQPLPTKPVTEPSNPELLIGALPPVSVEAGRLPMPPARAMPPPPVALAPTYKAKPKSKPKPTKLILGVIVLVILMVGVGGYFFLLNDDSVAMAPLSLFAKRVAPVVETTKAPILPIAPVPPPPAPFHSLANTPKQGVAPPVPVPTPDFRLWVSNVRVSGVRSGELPLAIINGRLARPGDIVDAAEGVVLVGVEGEQKFLSFRSRNGAVLTKPY